MDRQPAGSFDCFAVMPRKIETIGFEFNAHRDADARRRGFRHVISGCTQVANATAIIIAQMASLTKLRGRSYSAVSLHDEETIPENSQYNCFAGASQRPRRACR